MSDVDAAAVTKVLEDFAVAYAAKDVEGSLRHFTSDPDAVMVGTGGDEIRIGPAAIREQLERDLAQADEIDFVLGDVAVSGRGDVAWVFAEPVIVVTIARAQVRMPVRLTAVLVQDDGEWRIHSGHISMALGEQQAGESFATSV
jgi:uncharacterized protein (TIGR02246 family)